MGLIEDIDRVTALVRDGSDEQQAWFREWGQRFVAAADAGDDSACEDLGDILIVYERSVLRPPERFYRLEELVDKLGFDRREIGLDK